MRDAVIDIGKGIGIFLVIWGHTVCPISDYIYTFHIPFFFLISGYFYSHTERYGEFLIKNIKRLLYPYVGYSLFAYFFYAVWYRIFLSNRHYDYDSIVKIMAVNETVIAPLWFLISLFEVIVIYSLIRRAFSDNKKIVMICLVFTIIGYLASPIRLQWNLNYFHIASSFSMMFFYSVGALFRSKRLYLYPNEKSLAFCSVSLVFILFLITSKYSSGIDINSNRINAPFFIFLFNAFSGSWLILGTASVIHNIPFLRHILIVTGEKSMAVFALHFPLFEISRPIANIFFENGTYAWGFFLSIECLAISLLGAYIIDVIKYRVKVRLIQ